MGDTKNFVMMVSPSDVVQQNRMMRVTASSLDGEPPVCRRVCATVRALRPWNLATCLTRSAPLQILLSSSDRTCSSRRHKAAAAMSSALTRWASRSPPSCNPLTRSRSRQRCRCGLRGQLYRGACLCRDRPVLRPPHHRRFPPWSRRSQPCRHSSMNRRRHPRSSPRWCGSPRRRSSSSSQLTGRHRHFRPQQPQPAGPNRRRSDSSSSRRRDFHRTPQYKRYRLQPPPPRRRLPHQRCDQQRRWDRHRLCLRTAAAPAPVVAAAAAAAA
jgi:hypothetical protein